MVFESILHICVLHFNVLFIGCETLTYAYCLQREMSDSVQTLDDLTADESVLEDVDAFMIKQEVIM